MVVGPRRGRSHRPGQTCMQAVTTHSSAGVLESDLETGNMSVLQFCRSSVPLPLLGLFLLISIQDKEMSTKSARGAWGKRVFFLKARFVGTISFYMCVRACSVASVMSDPFATLWTIALQAPLSMGFSRQEYWGGLPCPPPGDLSDPGIQPVTPALAGRF